MQRPLDHIRYIPHFHLIRMVEFKLFSCNLKLASAPFLDLGCGNGEFGRVLDLSQVFGIDIDEAALSMLSRDGYYSDVQNASAAAIPYPDSFFRCVFSNCAVEHMDDLKVVLREVGRVLEQGGMFVFTVPTPSFFDVVKNDKVLIDIGLAEDAVIAEYNRIHHHVNIMNLVEWSEFLIEAGFKIETHTPYLPNEFGAFVARMDMLYTIVRPETRQLIAKLEKQHKSLSGILFRWRIRQYLKNPQAAKTGTHLIIKAIKV